MPASHVVLCLPSRGPPVRLPNPAIVAQEVRSRLGRLFGRVRNHPDLCALNLPVEIMLMIATHLDNTSLVSLALTCKSLHNLWQPRSLPLQLPEKEKLLLSLEKDIPFLYYCQRCTKLYRWHGRWSRSITPEYAKSLQCGSRLDQYALNSITCYMPYYYARLLMNRHLYGRDHGPPLHVLNRPTKTYLYPDDEVTVSLSQHARILNQQLLIRSTMSMTHRRGDIAVLRNHINRHRHSLCFHLKLRHKCQELALGPGKDECPDVSGTGSCVWCLTDYDISILWQGLKKGHKIEVHVYRGLGDCRTDLGWHGRGPAAWGMPPRTVDFPGYHYGVLKKQWDEAR